MPRRGSTIREFKNPPVPRIDAEGFPQGRLHDTGGIFYCLMLQKKPSDKKGLNELISKFSTLSPLPNNWISTKKEIVKLFIGLMRGEFTGKVHMKFEGGKISIRVSPDYPKDKMTPIYAKYAGFFESKRNEFIGTNHVDYGADKFAVEETKKEIELKEGIIVNSSNLKQAMTRIFVRRPLKTKSLD